MLGDVLKPPGGPRTRGRTWNLGDDPLEDLKPPGGPRTWGQAWRTENPQEVLKPPGGPRSQGLT